MPLSPLCHPRPAVTQDGNLAAFAATQAEPRHTHQAQARPAVPRFGDAQTSTSPAINHRLLITQQLQLLPGQYPAEAAAAHTALATILASVQGPGATFGVAEGAPAPGAEGLSVRALTMLMVEVGPTCGPVLLQVLVFCATSWLERSAGRQGLGLELWWGLIELAGATGWALLGQAVAHASSYATAQSGDSSGSSGIGSSSSACGLVPAARIKQLVGSFEEVVEVAVGALVASQPPDVSVPGGALIMAAAAAVRAAGCVLGAPPGPAQPQFSELGLRSGQQLVDAIHSRVNTSSDLSLSGAAAAMLVAEVMLHLTPPSSGHGGMHGHSRRVGGWLSTVASASSPCRVCATLAAGSAVPRILCASFSGGCLFLVLMFCVTLCDLLC